MIGVSVPRAMMGGYGEGAAVGNNFFSIFCGPVGSGASIDHEIPVPFPMTVSRLFVKVQTAPGAGQSHVFTVMKNGAATSIVATVDNANTTANDTTNTARFEIGDTIGIRIVVSAGAVVPARARWAVEASP